MPRFAAIMLVAPIVRFNAFAIFLTPCLSFAIDFNNRKSSLVHVRRITFFFLAISVPFFGTGFYHGAFGWQSAPSNWQVKLSKDTAYGELRFLVGAISKQRSSSIWRAKSSAIAFR